MESGTPKRKTSAIRHIKSHSSGSSLASPTSSGYAHESRTISSGGRSDAETLLKKEPPKANSNAKLDKGTLCKI
jgi:hypothetical protein